MSWFEDDVHVLDEPDELRAEREAAHVALIAQTNGHPPDVGETPTSVGDRTSWWPTPIERSTRGLQVPTIMRRSDGIYLLYRGKVHAFVGESEGCKTFGTLVAAREVIETGGHVLVVDFEDDADTTWDRLAAMGVSLPAASPQVLYASPAEPLMDRQGRWTAAQRDLDEIAHDVPLSLVIFDGVTEGMGLDGLNPLDNAHVASWYRAGARRLSRAPSAPATIVSDHVVKDREGRGRYALGGVHKLNGLDGASYLFEAVEPFGKGRTGIVTLTVAKDRPGQVRRHEDDKKRIATLRLESDPDTGAITTTLGPPAASGPIGDFEPTHLMEKVSRRCELYPGTSKRELRELGKSEWVDQAVSRLIDLGHLEVTKVGSAHKHTSISPYREHPDQ